MKRDNLSREKASSNIQPSELVRRVPVKQKQPNVTRILKVKKKRQVNENDPSFVSGNLLVKHKDLLKRVLITLFILLLIRVGSYVTVPGIQVSKNFSSQASGTDFFNLLSLLGGGTIGKFSILALGVSPYITASIIVQLLSTDVVPSMTRWAKSGEKGRKKLDRVTKYLTVPFALMQGIATIFTLKASGAITPKWDSLASGAGPGYFYYLLVPVSLLAGTFLMLWLSDQITTKGVGNGVSIIIFAGIVSRLPFSFKSTFQHWITGAETGTPLVNGIMLFTIYCFFFLLLILFTIVLNESERRIPIQQTGSGLANRQEQKKPYLPLKVNCAGVIPVIFSSALLSAPITVSQIIQYSNPSNPFVVFVKNYLSFQSWSGIAIYGVLTILFTFLYSQVQINPDKISENFQKSGTFIPGVAPGKETAQYLRATVNRLSILGSVALALIAVCPYIIAKATSLPRQLAIGGTGLIIMVSVSLQTIRQFKGRLIQQTFVNKKKQTIAQGSDYSTYIW